MKPAKPPKAIKASPALKSFKEGIGKRARRPVKNGAKLKVTETFAFPSMIWHADFAGGPAFNAKLIAVLDKLMAKHPSIKKSNVGGWHSPAAMQHHAVLKPLATGILRMADTIARSMKTDARARFDIDNLWITVNPKGAYNSLHDHPESVLSGVYYVQCNSKSGRLRFRDPRSAKRMAPWPVGAGAKTDKRHWDLVALAPVAGRAVMFPSWLEHDVEVNQSEQQRISIAFNLVFRRIN